MSEPEKRKWPRGLSPGIFLLGLISCLADIAGEMLMPVTPIFLTTVLGASALNLGLVEGIADALASGLKTLSGSWSDRLRRRRPFIVGGYLLAAVAKPMIGLSSTWIDVLWGRAFDRVGKGVRGAPRDALLADLAPIDERARAFGWHRALDTIGAVLGPLFALWLLAVFQNDFRKVYFVAFMPGLFAVILALYIKEAPVRAEPEIKSSQEGLTKPRSQKLSRSFWIFQFAWALSCLGNFSDAFLILKTSASGFNQVQTVLVYCFYNIIYALSSLPMGTLADRLGKKAVLCGGLFLFSIVYLGFGISNHPWFVVTMYGVYGVYSAATEGIGKSFAVDLVSADSRGYALGVMGAVTGFLALAASLIAGWIWQSVGPSWAFYFGAGCSFLGACVILMCRFQASGD